MVTQLDLVAEQLRVADGLPLSFSQDSVVRHGHSIECRINAENPATGFMPSPGTISRMRVPSGPGVRWDGGYEQGDTVSQYYDNLIGKLVVWAPDRDGARARAVRALNELVIDGLHTTTPAHIALLQHPDFAAGNHSTKWVEEELDASMFSAASAPAVEAPVDGSPPEELTERTVPVEVNGKRFAVRVWLPATAAAASAAPAKRAARPKPAASGGAGGGGDGTISAPMQGTIVKVLVEAGQAVELGEAVLVLEAMKMENHINAEKAGTVKEVRVAAGDTVGTGDVLVVIE
jgi:acetyl-CoA/propionyl-CoA/long-chain acyl-CoA carboxylase, biotin carboxylase, biotin carboxyl carrier protein